MDRKVVIRKDRREFKIEKRWNLINYLYLFIKYRFKMIRKDKISIFLLPTGVDAQKVPGIFCLNETEFFLVVKLAQQYLTQNIEKVKKLMIEYWRSEREIAMELFPRR